MRACACVFVCGWVGVRVCACACARVTRETPHLPPRSPVQLWRHECIRVLADRLVDDTEVGWLGKRIANAAAELLGVDAAATALKEGVYWTDCLYRARPPNLTLTLTLTLTLIILLFYFLFFFALGCGPSQGNFFLAGLRPSCPGSILPPTPNH